MCPIFVHICFLAEYVLKITLFTQPSITLKNHKMDFREILILENFMKNCVKPF